MPRTRISYRSCATRVLVKMAGELSVAEVGSCTVSQVLLRMQSTMYVFEFSAKSDVAEEDVTRSRWDFISGPFSF